jgi:hypothetical protein
MGDREVQGDRGFLVVVSWCCLALEVLPGSLAKGGCVCVCYCFIFPLLVPPAPFPPSCA